MGLVRCGSRALKADISEPPTQCPQVTLCKFNVVLPGVTQTSQRLK